MASGLIQSLLVTSRTPSLRLNSNHEEVIFRVCREGERLFGDG